MTSFKQYYRCYSISQTGHHSHLESGDKILLPASALERLSTMRVEYPLLFRLRNPASGKLSHCGVMEFSADEGTALLPAWLMANVGLADGGLVEIDSASGLEKATFVRLRPHETAFVELSNPKAVLETTLRAFSCLTVGDTIVIGYLGRKFSIDVCETRPNDRAVSIIETDCEVDFATPLDYKEPEKAREAERPKSGGAGAAEEQAKFRPFVGVGRRLKGGSSTSDNEAAPRDEIRESGSEVQNDVVMGSGCCESSSTGRGGNRKAGKLVFGGSEAVVAVKSSISGDSKKALKDNNTTDDNKGKAVVKEEEKDFKPFSGKSYRLSG